MRTRVTDSIGVTAEYTPIEEVEPGDAITEGWRPWPVVSRVQTRSGDERMEAQLLFTDGGRGGWAPFGTLVPVEVLD